MKILAFSDLHRDVALAQSVVSASRSADVVVGAGDFATRGVGLSDTIDILRQITVPVVLVPGNHDNPDELRQLCANWPDASVLHGEGVQIGQVPFFGIGFGSGPVNPEAWNRTLDESVATSLMQRCPQNAVVVSHSPPFGLADQQKDGRHDGSVAIRDAVANSQFRLVLCGHIHNGWGKSGLIGQTPVHNLGPHGQMFTV